MNYDSHIVMATHGIILITSLAGLVSSLSNRKKLNDIHISVNGGLTDKIKQAIKEAKE